MRSQARRSRYNIGISITAAGVLIAGLVGLTITGASAASGPFTIDGTVPDSGLTAITDPAGSNKELGPSNGSPTKIGVIHSAAVPMLGLTNPNAQVDLNRVWLDLRRVGSGSSARDWLYFAWQRDSNSGSGFIAYEFMQNAASSACTYDTLPASQADVIAGCNPFASRAAGDFMILWDQQGGNRVLSLRTWSGTAPNLTLSAPVDLDADVSEAKYSSDGYKGEAAVNITDALDLTVGACTTIANTVPSTVTGNSDSADYKDTVLTTKKLSTCGSLSVAKSANDGQSQAGAVFTLYKDATVTLGVVTGTVVGTCTVNASGACLWSPNSATTLANLQNGSYVLDETTVPTGYTKDASLPESFTTSGTGLVSKSYTNTANPASISLSKVDDAGSPMSGVVFTLYNGTGPGGTVHASCTTNALGNCDWDPGVPTQLTLANLQGGSTYTLDEAVPSGYALPTGTTLPYTFTPTNGQTIGPLSFTNDRLFKVITIVCKQAGPALYPSAITVNGTAAGDSLSAAQASTAGLSVSALCGITTGARSGLKAAATGSVPVTAAIRP
jgi:hypothetical protein